MKVELSDTIQVVGAFNGVFSDKNLEEAKTRKLLIC